MSRSNARYVVVTDLSEFYSSLYTHSVPWAIHGKSVAKANRTSALYGNGLDRLLRECQDQQTVGIPIGPDTSLVVAELVLCAVDGELTKRLPHVHGLRFMDDFELYFNDPSGAERGLATVQETLLEYELRLNPRKTNVEQLPIGIEPEWVHGFRNFSFAGKQKSQAKDLIRYFDVLTEYFRENPKEHIVRYALARIQRFPIHATNWALYQSLLAAAVTVEPGAVQIYCEILGYCVSQGHTLDRVLTESTLNAIIEASAPLGHHHEIVWSLWAMLCFGLSVYRSAGKVIANVDNSLVALIALDAEQNGLVPAGLTKTRWESRMTTVDLYEDQWLLSYEANVKGWLPSLGGGNHVSSDPSFDYLRSLGIEFYTRVPVGIASVSTVSVGGMPTY